MKAELDSAASYMASIMPRGLAGKVDVSSRYLPSRELGGDSFDYTWIDEEHLLVCLIDVSGHGIEPALLSVSVHNMLRSGSLSKETRLVPEAVLAELNRRFQMDQQSDHYFTLWYGVYKASTRTLRYVSAGAPPALAFTSATGSAVAVTGLSTTSVPVGIFVDTVFTSSIYEVRRAAGFWSTATVRARSISPMVNSCPWRTSRNWLPELPTRRTGASTTSSTNSAP